MIKESFINENVNGLVNIFNVLDKVEEFKKSGPQIPMYKFTDPGSICKLLMLVNRKIIFSIEVCESKLIVAIKNNNSKINQQTQESKQTIYRGEKKITIAYLKMLLNYKNDKEKVEPK